MNFYYGSGKIDWREFRERINHETDNDCLRNAILAWMIGIVYLVIGVFYWKQWMAQCDLKEQAIWILPVLGGAPIFLGICSAFSRRLGDWPHCRVCLIVIGDMRKGNSEKSAILTESCCWNFLLTICWRFEEGMRTSADLHCLF